MAILVSKARWLDGPWIWAALWTLFFAAPTTINAFSVLSDAARRGWAVRVWEPFVWEYTSLLASLVAVIPFTRLMVLGWRARPRWRWIFLWGAAPVLYSIGHIAIMVIARQGIYVWLGGEYDFGDWRVQGFYEVRKDAVTCMTMVALVAAVQTIRDLVRATPAAPTRAQPALLVYALAGRTVRLAPEELIHIRACDHYVEIVSDRGSHLVRRSLADLERALQGTSVRRTHRSWLVNLDRVLQTDPTPSGDWALTLPGGAIAPLGRRRRSVLRHLKGDDATA